MSSLQTAIDELQAIYAQNEAAELRAEIIAVLRQAQEDVCSLNCPSVKKIDDDQPWPHVAKCQAVSDLIDKLERL